jgi:hypothetical protein
MILLCSSCYNLAVKLISGTHYFVYLFTQKCISSHPVLSIFYKATTIISCNSDRFSISVETHNVHSVHCGNGIVVSGSLHLTVYR